MNMLPVLYYLENSVVYVKLYSHGSSFVYPIGDRGSLGFESQQGIVIFQSQIQMRIDLALS